MYAKIKILHSAGKIVHAGITLRCINTAGHGGNSNKKCKKEDSHSDVSSKTLFVFKLQIVTVITLA